MWGRAHSPVRSSAVLKNRSCATEPSPNSPRTASLAHKRSLDAQILEHGGIEMRSRREWGRARLSPRGCSLPRGFRGFRLEEAYRETPLFAALGFQGFDHRGGSNDPGGFVTFEAKKFLVASHQELSLAGFSQAEQITVLRVWGDRAGGQVAAKEREVSKAGGEQFGCAGAKSCPEKRSTGNIP